MTKIDVAINSYKKPESLIYTLMTLKKVAADLIDTVYINDDCSDNGAYELYTHPAGAEYFKPWKLDVRVNTHNVGIKEVYVRGYRPAYMRTLKFMLSNWKRFYSSAYSHNREDIRYQYALDHTDKDYLMLMHDDVMYLQDVVSLYLQTLRSDDKIALVGELGQCWRCRFADICNPQKIMQGERPSPYWPLTPSPKTKDIRNFNPKQAFSRECRINEWVSMVNVKNAREITEKSRSFFGNMYKHADTGAYWFGMLVDLGYKFSDPFIATNSQVKDYYDHAWQGHSGHSVWVNQGDGKSKYNAAEIIDRIRREFGFEMPEIVGK